jgi:hypothetical protein
VLKVTYFSKSLLFMSDSMPKTVESVFGKRVHRPFGDLGAYVAPHH